MNKAEALRELLIIFVRRFGLLNASITQACCGENVSIVHSHILYEIGRRESPSMQLIAGALGIDITTFSRQVKSMIKKGLIEKRPDKSDRRVSLLLLTPEGTRIKQKIDLEMNRYVEDILSQMSHFEQETVMHAMALLNESLLRTGKTCNGKIIVKSNQ